MVRRVLSWALGAVVLTLLVMTTWPQAFQLHRLPVAAQLVAFRGTVLVLAAVLFLVVLILALSSTRSPRLAGLMLIGLLAVVLSNGLVLFQRGTQSAAAASGNGIVMLSWNVLRDSVPVDTVAGLVRREGAQVVALQEISHEHAEAITDAIQSGGDASWQLFTLPNPASDDAAGTALLISSGLGEYRLTDAFGGTRVNASIVAEPTVTLINRPMFIAVHAAAPMPWLMPDWDGDLRWLASMCNDYPAVLLGDFNATIDHFSGLQTGSNKDAVLGSCVDAASTARSAAHGTWPTLLPSLLGSPIDHIMATKDWRIDGYEVIQDHDNAGSDHRPIVASLHLQ